MYAINNYLELIIQKVIMKFIDFIQTIFIYFHFIIESK